jgi:hypothetical protein
LTSQLLDDRVMWEHAGACNECSTPKKPTEHKHRSNLSEKEGTNEDQKFKQHIHILKFFHKLQPILIYRTALVDSNPFLRCKIFIPCDANAIDARDCNCKHFEFALMCNWSFSQWTTIMDYLVN